MSYWESRKAREAYEMYARVEDKADELAKIYAESSDEITLEIRRLFRKFQLKHNLSERDANVLLQGIDSTELKQIISRLRTIDKDMAAELEAPAYTARINRLGQIQRNVDTVATSIAMASGPMFYDILQNVGMSAFYHSMFDMQQQANAGFFFNPLTPQSIDEILSRKWSGESYSKRIWDNRDDLAREVKRELVKGMLMGKSPFRMSQVVEDRFHAASSNARRLMRTEANYVANQTTLLTFKEAGVKEYIYVAILDLRTSEICRSLDKKRFLVEKAEVGVNYPPMHPWCRSTVMEWMPDYLLRHLRQSAIDPNTGERIYVSGDMTYDQWYRRYVYEVQSS